MNMTHLIKKKEEEKKPINLQIVKQNLVNILFM